MKVKFRFPPNSPTKKHKVRSTTCPPLSQIATLMPHSMYMHGVSALRSSLVQNIIFLIHFVTVLFIILEVAEFVLRKSDHYGCWGERELCEYQPQETTQALPVWMSPWYWGCPSGSDRAFEAFDGSAIDKFVNKKNSILSQCNGKSVCLAKKFNYDLEYTLDHLSMFWRQSASSVQKIKYLEPSTNNKSAAGQYYACPTPLQWPHHTKTWAKHVHRCW